MSERQRSIRGNRDGGRPRGRQWHNVEANDQPSSNTRSQSSNSHSRRQRNIDHEDSERFDRTRNESYQDAFEANFGQPINRNRGDHDWVTDGSYSQFDTNTTWPRNRLGPLRREVRPFDPRDEVDNRPMALYNPPAVNTTAVTPTPNNPQVIDITNDDPYLNDPSANDHELALAVQESLDLSEPTPPNVISETSFYVGIVQNSFEEDNLKKEYAYFKRRGFEKWLVYYKNKPIVPKSIGKTDRLPDWPDSLKDLKCFICLNLPFCIQYCLDCRRYWCKQCWNDEIVRSNFCYFKPKPNGRDAANNQSYLGYREHRLGDISIEKQRMLKYDVEIVCDLCPGFDTDHPTKYPYFDAIKHFIEGCPQSICNGCNLYALDAKSVHTEPNKCVKVLKDLSYWLSANNRYLLYKNETMFEKTEAKRRKLEKENRDLKNKLSALKQELEENKIACHKERREFRRKLFERPQTTAHGTQTGLEPVNEGEDTQSEERGAVAQTSFTERPSVNTESPATSNNKADDDIQIIDQSVRPKVRPQPTTTRTRPQPTATITRPGQTEGIIPISNTFTSEPILDYPIFDEVYLNPTDPQAVKLDNPITYINCGNLDKKQLVGTDSKMTWRDLRDRSVNLWRDSLRQPVNPNDYAILDLRMSLRDDDVQLSTSLRSVHTFNLVRRTQGLEKDNAYKLRFEDMVRVYSPSQVVSERLAIFGRGQVSTERDTLGNNNQASSHDPNTAYRAMQQGPRKPKRGKHYYHHY